MTTSRKFTLALSYLNSVLDDTSYSRQEVITRELDSLIHGLKLFRNNHADFFGRTNYYPRG